MSQSPKVVKKKVSPYPIPAQISDDKGVISCAINRLTLVGVLIDLKVGVLVVGSLYNFKFEFPVLREEFSSQVKVIKTYDSFAQSNPHQKGEIRRIVECHFMGLNDGQKGLVDRYLRSIGQRTGGVRT